MNFIQCSSLNFLPHQFKTHIELFSTFLGESREKPNVKFEKENREKPTGNFNCLFSISQLVCREKFSDGYYPSDTIRTGSMG